MKSLKSISIGLFIVAVVVALTGAVSAQEKVDDQDKTEITEDGMLRFDFVNSDWNDVIEWFAEQNEYSLYMEAESPKKTFRYYEPHAVSPSKGLDILNRTLIGEGVLLIRNRSLLTLIDITERFPDELIEEVAPADLMSRGEYELLRSRFDLSTLDAAKILEDVKSIVSERHREDVFVLSAANEIIVRELGKTLREVNSFLKDAVEKEIRGNEQRELYTLKFASLPMLMDTVGQLMGIDEGETSTEDGTFSYSDLGDRILLSGTPQRLAEFKDIAKLIDVADESEDGTVYEKPYLQPYFATGQMDPEAAFTVLLAMFDGDQDIKLMQEPSNGGIILFGSKRKHDLMKEHLAQLANSGTNHAMIQLEFIGAEEMLAKLQVLLGIDPLATDSKGPRLLADTDNDSISVLGSPHEVDMVRALIATHDIGQSLDVGRTNTRFFKTNDRQSETFMDVIEDIWGSTGRRNKMIVVRAEDRGQIKKRLESRGRQTTDENDPRSEFDRKLEELQDLIGPPTDDKGKEEDPKPKKNDTSYSVKSLRSQFVGVRTPFQDDEQAGTKKNDQDNGSGASSQELVDENAYQPPLAVLNIDGADVEIRQVQGGLVLVSDDLNALDDLEHLLSEMIDEASGNEVPAYFHLYHSKPADAKALLDELLGLSGGGGGGGGGGGIGGMMGGMLSNAMGGAGDALGNLFGGGGSSSAASSIELEGDVSIVVNGKLNGVYVVGATPNDLEIIDELIEHLDQLEPPVGLDLIGQTYLIPVNYRDLEELKEKIENQFGDLIKKESDNAPGAAQNAQAQQMMRMMQQLGGKGGGKSSGVDPEKQVLKARIGIDDRTSSILVTGPEHIYLKVLSFVQRLDIQDSSQGTTRMLNLPKNNVTHLAEILKGILGDKAEIVFPGDEEANGANGSTQNRARTTNGGTQQRANPASSRQSDQMRSAIMNAMRNGGGVNFGGGNRRGGGGSRGGSTRGGGGGRGGRGR